MPERCTLSYVGRAPSSALKLIAYAFKALPDSLLYTLRNLERWVPAVARVVLGHGGGSVDGLFA